MSGFTRACLLLFLLSRSGAEGSSNAKDGDFANSNSISNVFLQSQDASQMLTRKRRANSAFEELRKGNMERECVEERCSWEEAREIFENTDKTNEFWNIYFDGDSCKSQPCINNGVCKDGIGAYTCFCHADFQGPNCEIAIPQLCETNNGGCQHFCDVEQNKVHCSCVQGYFLGEDKKSCLSHDPYKCGVLKTKKTRRIIISRQRGNSTERRNVTAHVNVTKGFEEDSSNIDQTEEEDTLNVGIRIVGGTACPPGECPWQALLVNEEDMGFCGGTILNKYFILTAAHCINQTKSFHVVLGEMDREVEEGHEAIYTVERVLTHSLYVQDTYHNDIALIKLTKPIQFTPYIIPACLPEAEFAERVLMRQDNGLVSGFGRVREGGPQSPVLLKLSVPYVDRAVCIESSQFKITNRMFCAGYDKDTKDACQGDSGGPHVTRYRDTWFVTGVVSWGEGCAREGKYGVYTQVSKFIRWIQTVMKKY